MLYRRLSLFDRRRLTGALVLVAGLLAIAAPTSATGQGLAMFASPRLISKAALALSNVASAAMSRVACSNDLITFTACPNAVLAPPLSTNTWTVTLLNESGSTQSGQLSCARTGQVSSCSLSSSSYSILDSV